MGKADYLALGDWNAKCDRCGRKFKASTMRATWQNYRVCDPCYETRQPQDFVRSPPDPMQAPWVRSPPAPEFILFCDINGISALPDMAVADCSICDNPGPRQ